MEWAAFLSHRHNHSVNASSHNSCDRDHSSVSYCMTMKSQRRGPRNRREINGSFLPSLARFLPPPCCSHAVFLTPHLLFLPFCFLILGQGEIIVLLPMVVTLSVVMATTKPRMVGPPHLAACRECLVFSWRESRPEQGVPSCHGDPSLWVLSKVIENVKMGSLICQSFLYSFQICVSLRKAPANAKIIYLNRHILFL